MSGAGCLAPLGARLLRDAGDDDLDRITLPLRTEGNSIIVFEIEGASRIDGIGVEDSLVFPTRDGANGATFRVHKADGCAACSGRTSRG